MSRGGLRHLPYAFARGAVAFVVIAAVGQLLAFGAWIAAGTGPSAVTVAKIGALSVGAFNHVALEFEVAAGTPTAGGATSVSIGVALLSVTAIAVWLLYRGGRSVADRAGGTTLVRALYGMTVAPAYALGVAALALVDVRTSLRAGAVSIDELGVSLSVWQAFAFPLAVAAGAGAAGGLSSALGRADAGERARSARAAFAGGWRMFLLGVVLSLGGLFVAGAVQADEPVALLTPSTARYWRSVLDRPAIGIGAVVHHVAALPNEATWVLVPSMGGCDVIRGDTDADLLCYGRVAGAVQQPGDPADADVPIPGSDDEIEFRALPAGYLLFLLVPALATVLGGRRAAAVAGRTGRAAVSVGAASGPVFAAFVGIAALLSTVVIAYGAGPGADGAGGWVALGPDVIAGTALATVWGIVGGAVGSATTGERARRTKPDRTVRPRSSTA